MTLQEVVANASWYYILPKVCSITANLEICVTVVFLSKVPNRPQENVLVGSQTMFDVQELCRVDVVNEQDLRNEQRECFPC